MSRIPMRPIALSALLLVAASAHAGDAWLGITMSRISDSMARALQLEDGGVLVDEVADGSPAATAGLQPGDVIVGIDGERVGGSKDLARVVRDCGPGDQVVVTVRRGGEERELVVTLGERSREKRMVWSFGGEDGDAPAILRWNGKDLEANAIFEAFGLGQDRGFLGIVPRPDDDRPGVVIGSLTGKSAAASAGLREGDRIVALDGQEIADNAALHGFLENTEPGQQVAVTAVRDDRRQEFTVTLNGSPGRLELGESLRLFMPQDPRDPGQPRFFEFHGGRAPDVDAEALEQERAELQRLKEELEQLERELQRIREDLPRKSER